MRKCSKAWSLKHAKNNSKWINLDELDITNVSKNKKEAIYFFDFEEI